MVVVRCEVVVARVKVGMECATPTFVDGHLRLRAPYPVRFAKLSSLKLG